jgi:hypothetical protein
MRNEQINKNILHIYIYQNIPGFQSYSTYPDITGQKMIRKTQVFWFIFIQITLKKNIKNEIEIDIK